MGITRRQLFSWMAAAAGSTALMTGRARAASTEHFAGYPDSFGVLHDTTLCIGCRRCEAACNEVNHLPPPAEPFDDLDVLDKKRRTTAKEYTIVNRYQPKGQKLPVFVKTQCNHCMEPACVSACFVKALHKSKDGPVTYDASLCVGCRYCMVACPFDIPAYEYNEPFSPRIMKCTMCQPRIEKGERPGCVAACPRDALTFGKRDDLIKIARQRIAKYPEKYIDHIYGEKEMGGTNWLYLAGVPFNEIGMRMDLGVTAAPYFTAGALSVVPMVVGTGVVLLTGIYAISQRKDRVAQEEKEDAVSATRKEAEQEMQEKLAEAKKKAAREKEDAVEKAVKKALEDAAAKAEPDDADGRDDGGEE